MSRGNNYVDYWRSLYPSGVAVGTNKFCPDGGCLGLFLNRYDLYQVFKPDLKGSWVEYNGATFAPTISPAPTAEGGCDNPHNRHLDKCFRANNKRKASLVAWDSLGPVGQLSVFLVTFMAVTLSLSIFLARARKKRRRGESYMGFLVRDLTSQKKSRSGKKKLRKKKKRRTKNTELEEDMLGGEKERAEKERSMRPPPGPSKRSKSKSRSSRSKSRSRHESSGSSRHRSSSRKRSSSKRRSEEDGKSRHRSKSRSSRSRSRSRSKSKHRGRSESASRSRRREKEEDEDMNRRQLV